MQTLHLIMPSPDARAPCAAACALFGWAGGIVPVVHVTRHHTVGSSELAP